MELDGAHTDVEFLSYFGICLPACDGEKHFFFTFCEGLEGLDWTGREGVGREAGEESSGDPGVDESVASNCGVDGLDQLLGGGAFEEKPRAPALRAP